MHVNRHKTTSAVAKAVELKCDQKNGETMVVKLQGDNLLVLQQTPEESLQYQGLLVDGFLFKEIVKLEYILYSLA